MVVLLALCAALLFAVASVLQHHGARTQPDPRLRLVFLAALAARPIWLAGLGADALGYVCQFVALGKGSLVVVQPLLSSGLLFALPLGAAVAHKTLQRSDWAAAGAVVVGLSTFLVSAQPLAGRANASATAWLAMGAATCLPALAMVALAGEARSARRAMLLAGATGLLYALAAALTKTTAEALFRGWLPVVQSWQTYALILCGIAGMLTSQNAFAAGSLSASLPILSCLDPVVSVVVGAFGLGESMRISGPYPFLEALGLALMLGGIVFLARSPLVTGDYHVEQSARVDA